MNILQTNLKNSIFGRLVITFLIIIIPIYGLAIYMYNWGLSTVKIEISKSTIAQVSFYLEGLEKEIERMKTLQYDCLNDENLNKLAIRSQIMSIYESTESMRQLQQRLVTIRNSSVYIKNVSAHILPINRTISSNSGLDDLNVEKFKDIRVPAGLGGAQIISYKGGLYLSTLQKRDLLGSNPLYSIEIELDEDVFRQALTQFNTYNGSGSILISIVDKGIISNQKDVGNTYEIKNIIDKINTDTDSGTEYVNIQQKGYYVVHARSTYLNMILLKYIPQEYVMKPIKNFNIWVWVFSVAVIIIILIYSFSTYKFMHKPLVQLVKSFRKVESGDLQVAITHDSNSEFGYLYKRFNDMVKNLNNLIDQVYNQRILMQRAELKQLQSQINPHFLYNSLFMINTMASIGDENLVPFSRYLGEYFRFVTRNSADYIPLIDEINHAKVYTNIQLMRFAKRLRVDFGECPEKYHNIKVPRLILQPIIENAFEHGIERKKNSGIVSVYFEENDKQLNIIVEDNGNDMTDEGLSDLKKALENTTEDLEITGILNINRRIKLVFGENSGLAVSRSEMGGLKVILKIIVSGGDEIVQNVDR
ncbi:sensor histidine kinase [Ruminiclostridium cellobioparum]|uniref:Signal transduction histidine kinase LytS n=1 Tax=Ruminiclostridium cellobioparum subsp. termitidis CT1112 TaxID=1195236 RepID=S0FPH1_RUMCE|nr:histidine kinase [Ruminiclostridium cellobioparum]EMS72256.1 signal transduction histidine kinase LytS [Ruminiclostridium cellobioparum subsp. termitidis CT1112]